MNIGSMWNGQQGCGAHILRPKCLAAWRHLRPPVRDPVHSFLRVGAGCAIDFCLWFLGILHALLQHAEHDGYAFGSVTLIGGLLFVTLMLAGAAIEIVHPATQARFANFHSDAQLGFVSLALSGWMYRFAFVGMATLIAGTSFVGLRTGTLPPWMVWAGWVCAVVALLRFFGPLGGWLTLAWIAAVSVLMLAGMSGRPLLRETPA